MQLPLLLVPIFTTTVRLPYSSLATADCAVDWSYVRFYLTCLLRYFNAYTLTAIAQPCNLNCSTNVAAPNETLDHASSETSQAAIAGVAPACRSLLFVVLSNLLAALQATCYQCRTLAAIAILQVINV